MAFFMSGKYKKRNPLLYGCQPDTSESKRLVTSIHTKGKTYHHQEFTTADEGNVCRKFGWTKNPKPTKVFVGFPFNQEFVALDIMFNELYNYVDYFIVVESSYSNAGKAKPLYFNQNLSRYAQFAAKTIHLVSDKKFSNSWESLKFQRNLALETALEMSRDHDNDLFILCDSDEIVKPPVISVLKQCRGYEPRVNFGSEVYLYNFGCLTDWLMKPNMARLTQAKQTYQKNSDIGDLRGQKPPQAMWIDRGAWHFSSFYTPEEMRDKVRGYSHQERNTAHNTNLNNIKQMMGQCKYINGKDYAYHHQPPKNSLPQYVEDHPQKFGSFLPKNNRTGISGTILPSRTDGYIDTYPVRLCRRLRPQPSRAKDTKLNEALADTPCTGKASPVGLILSILVALLVIGMGLRCLS